MGFYSVWPMLALLVAVWAVVATPLFRAADSPPIPSRSRVETLDGLRGFLALAVFFHHGALYHTFIQDGLWRPPPDRLYALLGPFGVALFFMITGFLFWSQILEKQGRPDWVRLYIGRIFRIGPIYWVAAGGAMLVTLALTGFRVQPQLAALALDTIKWSGLGVFADASFNGFADAGVLLANVTWSLRYEWLFYASLIVTALFARNRLTGWAFPAAGLAASMAVLTGIDLTGQSPGQWPFLALFFVGMLTAAAKPWVAKVDFARPLYSVAAAALMLAVLAIFRTAYDAAPIALLGAAFFLIANGATLFGLLATRPARRLGDVSFGIYLLQGFVLSALFASQSARDFALASPWRHWMLIGAGAFMLVGVATAAHALIERPGVDLGRWVAGRLRRKTASAQSGAPVL